MKKEEAISPMEELSINQIQDDLGEFKKYITRIMTFFIYEKVSPPSMTDLHQGLNLLKGEKQEQYLNHLHSDLPRSVREYNAFELAYYFISGQSVEDVRTERNMRSNQPESINTFHFIRYLEANPEIGRSIYEEFPQLVEILAMYEQNHKAAKLLIAKEFPFLLIEDENDNSASYDQEIELSAIFSRLEENNVLNIDVFYKFPELYSYLSQLIFAFGQPGDFPKFNKELLKKLAPDKDTRINYMFAFMDSEIIRWQEYMKKHPEKIENADDKKTMLKDWFEELRDMHFRQNYNLRPRHLILDSRQAFDDFRNELPSLMHGLFEEKDTYAERVIKAVMNENLILPRRTVIYADMMGCDPGEAKRYAALTYFIWGAVIKQYDIAFDGESVRKGETTFLAQDGVDFTISMAAISSYRVLNNILKDKIMALKIIIMLENSSRANLQVLNFEDSPNVILDNMLKINLAFSWFPGFLGETTGLEEAGDLFMQHQMYFQTLSQLVSDLKDVVVSEPGPENAKDIGSKITLPLKAVMETPDELFSAVNKQKLRSIDESEKRRKKQDKSPASMETRREIEELLQPIYEIRSHIVENLTPTATDLYNKSLDYLEKAADKLPKSDERNVKTINMLKRDLDDMLDAFKSYAL